MNFEYSSLQLVKDSLDFAILYCEEHIPTTDSWSKQGLLAKKEEFEKMKRNIQSFENS